MGIPRFKKSKYNNPPIIAYEGTCLTCGAKHISFEKGDIISCCSEQIKCEYVIDLNEGKVDCNFSRICIINNGLVAQLMNLGKTKEEAILEYKKQFSLEINLPSLGSFVSREIKIKDQNEYKLKHIELDILLDQCRLNQNNIYPMLEIGLYKIELTQIIDNDFFTRRLYDYQDEIEISIFHRYDSEKKQINLDMILKLLKELRIEKKALNYSAKFHLDFLELNKLIKILRINAMEAMIKKDFQPNQLQIQIIEKEKKKLIAPESIIF